MTTTKYKILDKDTNKVLAEVDNKEQMLGLVETYSLLDYNVAVNETASAGSTGAGSIAVSFGGAVDMKNKKKAKRFKDLFKGKIINTFNPSNFRITVTENFDIESVFSRLSSLEKAGQPKKTEGTTFGIEDDNGNIMKVTVRADQAKEFEEEVAMYLADIKMNVVGLPKGKDSADISMAELLFKMKDKYDIIDVEFPKIPSDVIYNADKASYKTADMQPSEPMGDDMGSDMPLSSGEEDDPFAPLDLTGEQPDETQPEMDADLEFNPEDDLTDDESVEDFGEEPTTSDEGSILDKVISMLKAQADAEIEKSKADAEKARAEQARYTAQATQFAIRDQEEQLRYELEMEKEKQKEKEAKKLADMAKHKISKTMSTLGGLSEAEEGLTPEMVQRQRQQIALRYKIEPTDTPEDVAYKNAQKNEAMREYASRYRQAQNKKRYDAIKAEKARKQRAKEVQDARVNQTKQQQQQQQQQQQGGTNPQQNPNVNTNNANPEI